MLESINVIETRPIARALKIIPYDVSGLIRPGQAKTPKETMSKEQKTLETALNIISDPYKLYDVPPLPYSYASPESPARTYPRSNLDKSFFRPVWSEVKDPRALDTWALESGFENLKDIYEGLPAKTVIEALNPVSKVVQELSFRVNEGKIRINQILEVMRGYQISQMLATESYRNGLDLIGRHLPGFVPVEPTVVIGEPSFMPQKGENGEYFGKVEGKHVLRIRTPPSPFLRLENYRAVDNAGTLVPIMGAHELMHQKHAEVTEGKIGFYPPDGSPLTIEFLETHTQGEINELVKEVAQQMGLPKKVAFGQEFGLIDALAEGVATSAEPFIDFAEARRLMRLGKKQEAEVFIEAGKVRRRELADSRNIANNLHYAVGTEEIVSVLFKTMGIAELGTFLANVDLVKAENIRYGTDAFNEILKDPRKLPQKSKKIGD